MNDWTVASMKNDLERMLACELDARGAITATVFF
jgi:hypothetical protein